jgi:hypothetical protein
MKKMTEAEWWQEPASAAACKILGLAEGTSQFECFMHALERIAEVNAAVASGKAVKEVPYVVKSVYGGYDAGCVIFAITKLKLLMFCDADRKLLCDTLDELKRSGAIPPEEELDEAGKRDAAYVAEKLMRGGELADEQKRLAAEKAAAEAEPPKRVN